VRSEATRPDRLLTIVAARWVAGLSPAAHAESVIASGAWSLVRHGDALAVRFDYADERESESKTIPVRELVVGLDPGPPRPARTAGAGRAANPYRPSRSSA
jgi:hypothetical protein